MAKTKPVLKNHLLVSKNRLPVYVDCDAVAYAAVTAYYNSGGGSVEVARSIRVATKAACMTDLCADDPCGN